MFDVFVAGVSKQILLEAALVKEAYKIHRGTSGKSKEDIVASFLNEFMPRCVEITTGLVFSHIGEFSSQADIVVVDRLNGAPLGGRYSNPIWFVESAYALIEVKSMLTPSELTDALEKCKKFKRLPRSFDDIPNQKLKDSLAVIWFFDTPSKEKTISSILKALEDVPMEERPDFIISPNNFILLTGQYWCLCRLGEPGSPYRVALLQKHAGDISKAMTGSIQILWAPEASLIAFLIWFSSWIVHAGSRRPDLCSYLPRQLPGECVVYP
jgi:hypothetical protein